MVGRALPPWRARPTPPPRKKVLSENAVRVLEERYLRRGPDSEIIETPAEMFRRVADAVAESDPEWSDVYYEMMSSLKFLPNSPTLSGAGLAEKRQLSACFVLPLEDSMASIMETAANAATIHKSGGGTGFDFTPLRPRGSPVGNTGGVAGGPVSFLSMYDEITKRINQGSMRRGANMGILSAGHPDILEFIDC